MPCHVILVKEVKGHLGAHSHIRMAKTMTYLPSETVQPTITTILKTLTNTSVKGVGYPSAH